MNIKDIKLNLIGTNTIETDRLILRRFTMDDAEYALENWMSDKKVCDFIEWNPYRNIEDVYKRLEFVLSKYNSDSYFNWVIELKEISQPIGNICMNMYYENFPAASVGFCIGSKWWNKGIMTEAFNAVIDYMFNKVGILRIEGRHNVRNIGSGRVMDKVGMTEEGISKYAYLDNSGICDVKIHGLINPKYS